MSKSSSESGSSSSDDSDDGSSSPMKSPSPSPQVHQPPAAQTSKHDSPKKDEDSEVEEGQVSSSDSDSSSDSEFNDGFDENLMGDKEDRSRLEGLSEKERETEIFKRIERRDMMKTRWEIERKLRIAKKAERAKDRTSKPKKKKKDKEKKRKEVQIVIPPKPVFKEPVVPVVADVSPVVSPEKGKEDGGGLNIFFVVDFLELFFIIILCFF